MLELALTRCAPFVYKDTLRGKWSGRDVSMKAAMVSLRAFICSSLNINVVFFIKSILASCSSILWDCTINCQNVESMFRIIEQWSKVFSSSSNGLEGELRRLLLGLV